MTKTKAATNLLINVNLLGLVKAHDIIFNQALKRLTLEDVKVFEQKYTQVLTDYLSTPKFAISNIFDVSKVQSFKTWITELLQEQQKDKYILFIIAKMMKQDPLAYNMYKAIYSEKNPELILTYDKVMEDDKLKGVYMNIGASIGEEAQLQAEYWLISNEAKDILCFNRFYDTEVDLLLSAPCDTTY